MNERRGPWFLFTGLAIGLLFGLLYAWVVRPAQLVDTSPDYLAPAFKEHYRSMIALAYESSGDLGRARGRLALLKDEDEAAELSAQAQRILAQGGSPQEARALAALAAVMGGGQVPAAPATPAVIGAVPAERTELPTLAVTLTPGVNANAAFALKQREALCDRSLKEGILQVDVVDASGRPVPGVRLIIRWPGGEEVFATGLYPTISPGYADTTMQPGVQYTLQAGTGEVISDLSTQDCPGSFNGGLRLFFVEE
jgi:hypothetical protein